MAKMMKPGVRVVRGKDWDLDYGTQDGNGSGTVLKAWDTLQGYTTLQGLWQVQWDNGLQQYYRMGFSGKYDLKIVDHVKSATQKTTISKLFLDKEFMDLKITCNGKTLECHRSVLSCQSDVFRTMFLNMDMKEAKSGEIEINDISAETMETFLYYLYHEDVEEKVVDTNLLFAADKYNIAGLVKVCNEYLKSNLSVENCLDVLLSAHLMNQKELFRAASDFANQNKGKLVRTTAWKEMVETNSKLTTDVLSIVLGLQ